MKYKSYKKDGVYRPQLDSAQVPDGATDVKKFNTEQALFDSVDYKAYKLQEGLDKSSKEDHLKVLEGGWSFNGNVTNITDFNEMAKMLHLVNDTLSITGLGRSKAPLPNDQDSFYLVGKADITKIFKALLDIYEDSLLVKDGTKKLIDVVIPRPIV